MKTGAPILDTEALDRAIAINQRRLDAIKQIRQILREFPKLLEEITPTQNGSPLPRKRFIDPPPIVDPALRPVTKSQNFEAVRKVFVARDNEWMSVPQVAKLLGWSRGIVSNVVYLTNPKAFEKEAVKGSKKKVHWRLRVPDATPSTQEER